MEPEPAIDLAWTDLNDKDREREYSPSSCVGGDIEPFLAEYAAASERARVWCASRGLVIETLVYGPAVSQTVDIVGPLGSGQVPLVVFIHGGYWQALSKKESFSAAPGYLSLDIAYAAVDYTLAPEASVSEIVDECRSAFETILVHAERLGIDADRIIICGSSAGAHLASMVGIQPSARAPAAMVLLSGVYELAPLLGTSINDALGLEPQTAHDTSPLHQLPSSPGPPALLAYGDNETDQFKRQSRLFAQQLAVRGAPATVLEVAGRNHFDIITDFGDMSSSLGQAILTLIESTGLPNTSGHGSGQ